MIITRTHTLGKEEAVARLNRFIEELHKLPLPSGVKIEDVSTQWENDRLHFSFKARKGIFATLISGRVSVDDQSLTLDADLPPIVTTFFPEERIADTIGQKLDDFFPHVETESGEVPP